MTGWRKNSPDDLDPDPQVAVVSASEQEAEPSVVIATGDHDRSQRWAIGGTGMLIGLGAGVGLVLAVIACLVTSVWWVGLIAALILTSVMVLLIAPLFIGEVMRDLVTAAEGCDRSSETDAEQ